MNFPRRINPKLERSSRNWQTTSMTLESATIRRDNQRSASRGPSFKVRLPMRYSIRSAVEREVASFLLARGELDAGISRYDAELKKNPNDPAAFSILTAIFTQAKRNDPRGPELQRQLDYLDRDLARQLAERLEKDAQVAPRTSSRHLKDAATAWLEAGDKTKALAAAKKSAAGPAENRTGILAMQWNEGLGDVFL